MSLAWTLEYAPTVRKQLRKLGHVEGQRITKTLDEIAELDDPRSRGHALTGDLGGLWRYRVGDWRIIARFENQRLVILVIEIGHRREVYR